MTKWLQASKRNAGPAPREERPSAKAKGVLSVLSVLSEGKGAKAAPPARADGMDPDAGAYLDFLRLHGPHTYGAAMSELKWGATRAWLAEAKLRALGLVRYGDDGKAHPMEPYEHEP